jgi:putative ABC transport system permease protein
MSRAEAKIAFYLVTRFLRQSSRWTLGFTIFLIAIAFINLVFISSLFNGVVEGSDEQIVNAFVGHVTVGPLEGQRDIADVDREIANILRTPGVVGASAQTFVPGALRHGSITLTRQIIAVDPDRERTVTSIAARMIDGSFLRADDTDGIVVGTQIAGGPDVEQNATSFRGAHIGDAVVLTFNGTERLFTLRGVFRTRLMSTDARAFITRRALDIMSPATRDRASLIIVRDGRRGAERATIAALRRNGVVGTFGTWQENAGIMRSVTRSFVSINVLMSLVGVMIAAVTIFIVMYIDIFNRKRQIGILRAIGISPWVIRVTYVLQSTVYAIAGVIVGTTLFFAAIVPYFRANPFSLPIGDAVLVTNPADYLARAGTVIAVAIVSGLIPAVFVTRMPLLSTIVGK